MRCRTWILGLCTAIAGTMGIRCSTAEMSRVIAQPNCRTPATAPIAGPGMSPATHCISPAWNNNKNDDSKGNLRAMSKSANVAKENKRRAGKKA